MASLRTNVSARANNDTRPVPPVASHLERIPALRRQRRCDTLPVQNYRGVRRGFRGATLRGREIMVRNGLQAIERTVLALIEHHYLGHEGLDAPLMRQTASFADRGEILPDIARIVWLVEILRKKLQETLVVWLVAALE
jgi:hypothetical protein